MTRARIAARSLWSRRSAVGLTALGIALSVAMILGVERVRIETRDNFTRTVAGTDLVVGARTSPVQLLLYSVFRIGDATRNVRYDSFEKIGRHPMVDWAVPISLGDSHRGFRVVGTTPEFFEHVRYGLDRPLAVLRGQGLVDRFDAVIGSQVARTLGYGLRDPLTIAHGIRDDGLSQHDALLFRVAGILAPTGTPVDSSVHVTLEAVAAIHVGWESGIRVAEHELHQDEATTRELALESITAFFMGLKRRSDALTMQRAINAYPGEPLLAILPGVALNELWGSFPLSSRR